MTKRVGVRPLGLLVALLCSCARTAGLLPPLRESHDRATPTRPLTHPPAWCVGAMRPAPAAAAAPRRPPCRRPPAGRAVFGRRPVGAVWMSGIGNPNAGGPGFKRLTGKRRFVPPEKRKEDWEAWRQTLTPEERATVDENDRLSFLNAHKWNATERMKETGCGEFDEHGNFVEGSAGRSTVWDKDPDGRWVLHQCPIAELPAALLRKDRFLHQHPGWFRDRPIFESVYLGMVKKPLSQSLTDFEYAELARLYMRSVRPAANAMAMQCRRVLPAGASQLEGGVGAGSPLTRPTPHSCAVFPSSPSHPHPAPHAPPSLPLSLCDRYQHVLTAEPLCDFIEYFFLQRGITLEVPVREP